MRKHKFMQIESNDFKKGHVFSRLTLTGKTYFKEASGQKRRMVEAICECGTVRDYVYDQIKRQQTRSCGCLQKDLLRETPHAKKHGLYKHPLFKVWLGMRERCTYEKHIGFHRWGGRGIYVCAEWQDDFQAFYKWCMANGWQKGLDIDRKDNDGIYEPSNCRFVTDEVSARNRSSSHMITAFGVTKCLQEWIEDSRCKVTYGGLRNRIGRDKKDWPDIEKAITTPPQMRGCNVVNRPENKMIFAFGEEKSIADWLKDERCVVSEKCIRNRIKKMNQKDREQTIEEILTTKERKSPTKK